MTSMPEIKLNLSHQLFSAHRGKKGPVHFNLLNSFKEAH